ncbi:MAG: DUF4368 domain-containing protein [Clostridiales bacterium]|jgi:hypothetical protein|nr:DUF4368 domain-containing protein [Clostridiales bacterium]
MPNKRSSKKRFLNEFQKPTEKRLTFLQEATKTLEKPILKIRPSVYGDENIDLIILNELIEKIEVYHIQGVGEARTREITIHYNFVSALDLPEIAEVQSRALFSTADKASQSNM